MTLTIGATSASAADATNLACIQTAKKVSDALNTNQQSAQYQDARQEANNGRDFCSHGLYKIGLDHYSNALKMLGQI